LCIWSERGREKSHVCMCMWKNECPCQSMHVSEARGNWSGGFKFAETKRERERERVCMAYGGRIVRLSSTEEKSLIFGLWMHVRTSLLLCFRNLIHGHLSSKSQVYRVCVYRPYKPTPPRFAPAIIWFASDTCTLYMC
jgi:hypothetical protein